MNQYRVALIWLAYAVMAASQTAAAKEIDWWRSPGAAVVEFADAQSGEVCSLFLYSRNAAAVVTWTGDDAQQINLYNNDWHFVPNQRIGIALQIGSTWLGPAANDAPDDLQAVTYADHLSVPVRQNLTPLLQHADGITAKLADKAMTVAAEPFRMPKLLHAVHRCRAALQRRQ